MTIREYQRIFRERWLVLVLAVLLGTGAGAAMHYLRPPKYTAVVQMYISTRAVLPDQALFQGEGAPGRRVKSYVELARSPRVMSAVVQRLGLAMSPAQLSSKVSAASSSDSVVINMFAVDESPEQAATIVNAAGQALGDLVDELERPTTSGGVAPVVVKMVQPAVPPVVPTGRGLSEWMLLGMLVGVAAGLVLALVRNAMDNTIKTAAQLREVSGVPNLGLIALDGQASKRPLVVRDDPKSAQAEAFRQLRTNVQFVDIENQHKILTVTSSMSGEGKTTTLVNLAVALAAAGSSVLVIEADLRRPKAAEILGMSGSVGLTSVIAGRMPVRQAIQTWGPGSIDLLASGPLPPNPSELLANPRMKALLNELRGWYDVILVDTPALVPVTDAASIAPATDGAILLCRFHETTKPQVEAALEALRTVAAQVLGSVFTMVPASGVGTGEGYRPRGGDRDLPVVAPSPSMKQQGASHRSDAAPRSAAPSGRSPHPRTGAPRAAHRVPDVPGRPA